MVPEDQAHEHHESESAVQNEIMRGLVAARQYEGAKRRLSPATQEEMMKTSFPHLPEGDVAKEMTPEETRQLQASMRDDAGDRTAESIANLRQQLTEYHSMLDQLSSMSAKYAALEKEFEKRGSRIQSLEAEVSALRMKKAQRSARRVSCEGIQGHGAAGFMPMSRMPVQQPQQQHKQHMQELPNPAMFQFQTDISSFVSDFQDQSLACIANHPMTPSHFPQRECLQARQNSSPSPLTHRQFPIDDGFHPGCGFPSNDQTAFNQAGALSPAPPKRAISGDYGSANGTAMPPHEPGAKRFRSSDFASWQYGSQKFEPDAFPSTESMAYLPEAA